MSVQRGGYTETHTKREANICNGKHKGLANPCVNEEQNAFVLVLHKEATNTQKQTETYRRTHTNTHKNTQTHTKTHKHDHKSCFIFARVLPQKSKNIRRFTQGKNLQR